MAGNPPGNSSERKHDPVESLPLARESLSSQLMRVIVTGGAGYIGSVMTRLLVEHDHEVTVLDNLSVGHRAAVSEPARLVVGDLADADLLDRLFKEGRFDCVMHFAARSRIPESVLKPGEYFENNVGRGINLLNAATTHGVGRFVFSSTASVYGEPDRMPITEEFPLKPTSPYGDTKRVFEELLVSYERACGLRYAALRYFNVVGAHAGLGEDHRPETHLVPLILQSALASGREFSIYGDDYDTRDGTCVRDYLHIHDLCSAHLLAMNAIEDRSIVYNLGSGTGFTVKEVFETAQEVIGRKLDFHVTSRRDGDPPVLVASSARIEQELGWKRGKPDLKTMIADAWQFHQARPDGYAD
jgi:UDP-glucose 4-epimerase